ncbi:MAG TPA: DNA polymerase III subunit delta' [Urbifossiella sp.]|jgi:DNA polymerase-3 subunit delta'
MGWERIRGHEAVVESFRTAFTRGRFGQAYLLLGPEGVGKRLFALELAKALLCEKSPAPLTACDHCPACAQVEAGTHPDVFRVRTPKDKHELPIDEIRAFCTQMAMKPSRGSRKIGIVEDADDFNQESANAFLKTLEEPAAGSVLLLRASSIDRQLPTILSRSQIVRFGPLKPDDLGAILRQHDIDDPEKIERLVKLSGGSVGQALALNDEEFWNLRQTLLNGLTSPRLNVASLVDSWKNYYEAAGKETRGQRLRTSLVLRFLVECLQQSLRLSLGADAPGLDPREESRWRSFADRLGADRLLELIDKCVEADNLVERRVMLILIVESVLEKFAASQAR